MYIFNSRINTLTIILRPSRRTVVGSEVISEPSIKARFENGLFMTEDPEVAELIRKKVALTHDSGVVEITSEEELAFERSKKVLNSRVAITAAETSKAVAGGVTRLEEKTATDLVKCPICDKAFKNQKALNMHLLSHRPGIKASADKAAAAVTLGEAPNVELAPDVSEPK
jgi:hypothetical protein